MAQPFTSLQVLTKNASTMEAPVKTIIWTCANLPPSISWINSWEKRGQIRPPMVATLQTWMNSLMTLCREPIISRESDACLEKILVRISSGSSEIMSSTLVTLLLRLRTVTWAPGRALWKSSTCITSKWMSRKKKTLIFATNWKRMLGSFLGKPKMSSEVKLSTMITFLKIRKDSTWKVIEMMNLILLHLDSEEEMSI